MAAINPHHGRLMPAALIMYKNDRPTKTEVAVNARAVLAVTRQS